MTIFANTLVTQCHALVHAEAVLFIDNDKGEIVEFHTLLEQGVRADDKLRPAIGNSRQRLTSRRRFLAATQPRRLDAERLKPV